MLRRGSLQGWISLDAHAEKLIPPKTTKASVTPKEIEKKPLAYWKAQCAFRGLNQTGAIADLQLRIREAKKKIQPEIKSVETELNKDFKKNIAARSDSWASKSVEKKAKTDPNKYLSEAFPKGGSGRPVNMDIVVLKIGADEASASKQSATNSWDVRGSYEIRCRDIEEQWGGHSLTLDIYLEIRNGKRQLYGAFDFNAIEGIMRFERPSRVPKSEMESEKSKKRKQEDLDNDGDLQMDIYPRSARDDTGKYSEEVFHLRSDEQPTARRPTWRYRWRGHETGEGEIQVNADRAVRSTTFSEKGNALSGYFKCDYVKDCYFEGIKVCFKPRDKRLDPESKWMSHSEVAHGYASRARWGGGGFGGW